MRKRLLSKYTRGLLLLSVGFLSVSPEAKAQAKIDPFNESKKEYDKRSEWFRDAKFGVFIHWNPSSVVGKEISWGIYPQFGGVPEAEYKQLYKRFSAKKFNAREWTKLFNKAGVRYSVIVPKHHDGFAMWNTDVKESATYNVMKSPFGRDYIKEIADACRADDVRFCLYYSIGDLHQPTYKAQQGADLTAYNKIMYAHLKELFTRYGDVGCMWFDGHYVAPNAKGLSWTHQHGRDLYAYSRKLQPNMLINNRVEPLVLMTGHDPLNGGSFYQAPDAVGDLQSREGTLGGYYSEKVWDSCCTLNKEGWAWVPPSDPKPLTELLSWMIECIGRDGNMLLGVGPRPDGTIDPLQQKRLLEMGDWLKKYGEAVYGTRGGPYLPCKQLVATRKADKVYLFVKQWSNNTVTLPALPANIKSARLMTGEAVQFNAEGKHWQISLPKTSQTPVATIIELTLDRDAMKLDTVKIAKRPPVSKGKPVRVSGVWPGRPELAKNHLNDGNFATVWAGPENSNKGWVEIDLGKDHDIVKSIIDDRPLHRAQKFKLQAKVGNQWKTLAVGTTIGSNKTLLFKKVTARVFRLQIEKASGVPTVAEFQLFEN